jgi:hypothetical protein
MSAPLNLCQISAAARGDEAAYQSLISSIKYNLTQPAYSVLGCLCKTPCPEPTEQQKKALDVRVKKDLEEYQAKRKL